MSGQLCALVIAMVVRAMQAGAEASLQLPLCTILGTSPPLSHLQGQGRREGVGGSEGPTLQDDSTELADLVLQIRTKVNQFISPSVCSCAREDVLRMESPFEEKPHCSFILFHFLFPFCFVSGITTKLST